MIIYKITNTITSEVYIGQTKRTLEERKSDHIKKVNRGKHSKLYNAMREYGIDNFVFETICTAETPDELNALEKYYIAKYDCINAGYNKNKGGSATESYKLDAEVRNNISRGMKQYRTTHPFTEEHRRKLSESQKGRKYDEERRKKCDTRSLGCYCLLEDGKDMLYFHSYRDAYKWWKTVDNPFETDAECIFQRKIKQSIDKGYFTYGRDGKKYFYPKWFRSESEVM